MDDAADGMQRMESDGSRPSDRFPPFPRPEGTHDSRICSKARISDIDASSLTGYRQRLKIGESSHPWNGLSDEDFLVAVGAADIDDQGELRLTIAGALMFSTERIISRELPDYFLECTVRSTLDRMLDERFTTIDGDWSGNVFDFFLRTANLMAFGSKNPFELKGFVRVDDTDQMKAERELLVNALVHADYLGKEGIRVEMSPDVLRIRNPGRFRMPVERALNGGHSDPGNKTMMKMMKLIGFTERAGDGLHKAMSVCDRMKIPRPEISESSVPDSVTVVIRRNSGFNVQDDAGLLEYIGKYQTETLAQMAEGTGLSTSTLSRRLKEFKEQGVIERAGGRRSGKWIVKSRE